MNDNLEHLRDLVSRLEIMATDDLTLETVDAAKEARRLITLIGEEMVALRRGQATKPIRQERKCENCTFWRRIPGTGGMGECRVDSPVLAFYRADNSCNQWRAYK